ncbi:flagellar basal-body rod protein FlgF [Colwellia sp. PAMC 21821]|uniref:flagellar basal-body rod protein FlgF n=1 Tax=Colwellia sp. PAMC 21821 TaxID=1816219 RepID=UPI0009BDEEBE|nr:flagellar basal-body rod protein FlgF [Colwellia sp. PAMC 21821]ARD43647.1 flagellar biosynthesis protein FlgF [Colwellia sp. PAMC 21821]
MDKLLYIAMSGAKQNMQALSVNANNLANAKTTGFKADLANARAMQAFGEGMPTRVFSMTERAGQNFDSGALLSTGRDLDVAIQGEGWLAVQTKDGNEAYTRNGQLKLNDNGALETSRGDLVIGDRGPIFLPLPISKLNISADGTIMVQPEGAPSNVQEEVGRIKFVNPDNRLLEKGSDGLFRRKDGNNEPADITVKVASGSLESSNVNPISEMTDMIALQRQFEMQLKMMKTAEEIDSSAASLLRAF